MRWFMPAWNGDFRLEGATKERSILKIANPTPYEEKLLAQFLMKASKKKWTETGLDPQGKGRTQEIVLAAPLAKVEPVLLKLLKPARTTLSAVRFEDGRVITEHGTNETVIAQLAERAVAEKAKAAVSVARPTPSCPACAVGAIGLADEVLQEFLTDEEHASWAAKREIVVTGGYTSHRYRIAHRHTRIAARQGRLCMDLDDGRVLHAFDWSVPPEEEVLAFKLILEHREDWLRNEATCLGQGGLPVYNDGGWTDVFKNPFGGVSDGTESHPVAEGIGALVLSALGGQKPALYALPFGGVVAETPNGIPTNFYGQPLY